jgi:hypothetical protein
MKAERKFFCVPCGERIVYDEQSLPSAKAIEPQDDLEELKLCQAQLLDCQGRLHYSTGSPPRNKRPVPGI